MSKSIWEETWVISTLLIAYSPSLSAILVTVHTFIGCANTQIHRNRMLPAKRRERAIGQPGKKSPRIRTDERAPYLWYTGLSSQERTFPRYCTAENTQLSPFLTKKPCITRLFGSFNLGNGSSLHAESFHMWRDW